MKKWLVTDAILGFISFGIHIFVIKNISTFSDILLLLFCVVALLSGRAWKINGGITRKHGPLLGVIYGGLSGISSVFLPSKASKLSTNGLSSHQTEQLASLLASPGFVVVEILVWILLGVVLGILFFWIGGLVIRKKDMAI